MNQAAFLTGPEAFSRKGSPHAGLRTGDVWSGCAM